MLRASGVDYDVRKDRPYLGYDEFDFDVPVGEHGDIYDRYLVRFQGMVQSPRIRDQSLERLRRGELVLPAGSPSDRNRRGNVSSAAVQPSRTL